MSFLAGLRLALAALSANRLRSALTMLGLVIGIGAVIALMSIGRGARATVTAQIESLGTNLVFVRSGFSTAGPVRGGFGSAATLTMQDAEAIAKSEDVPAAALVAPEVSSGVQLVAGAQNLSSRIIGVTPEYQVVRNFFVADGEFITAQQVQTRALVAVLGSNVAETLFGEVSPVGQRLRINNRPFTVIGVLAPKGGTFLGLQDDAVVAPITTVQQRISGGRTGQGRPTVQQINVQVADTQQIEAAKMQIATVLRRQHRITGDDDFTITSQEETIQTFAQVTNTFTIFLGAVAGISLLVGGIGIMNIMLVSVTERIREIGIRKAVGARRQDILLQFLLEAIVLTLVGGVLGILMGWGASQGLKQLELNGQRITTLVSADIILLALSVSVAIGLFFGIYPAARASRLDPIEALRHQ